MSYTWQIIQNVCGAPKKVHPLRLITICARQKLGNYAGKIAQKVPINNYVVQITNSQDHKFHQKVAINKLHISAKNYIFKAIMMISSLENL